ncbi:glycosyltransferase family 2 protein [Allosediminivita pacifica]|uniref:Succinoglycan biosynthesis protein ExoM n=1 Tax=Allosediminivita pacifica TaxID=1267769 RepID=A0A2T6B5J2_9RHOB|nr:glycosyltransferase [Allosediminivita pacifica]PTX51302.1 succinoglycan biosynthesis protein ExoM [Allosediminivita pacifica]GGA98726.1 glycosyl transferase family A [Allosediminivita pacifica]
MTTVAITLCTFRRPGVADTLRSIFSLELPKGVDLRVIVADNDTAESGRAAVEGAAADAPCPVTYLHAPAGNISIARNAGLDHAGDADWVAFLDDDEVADPEWLARLLNCAAETGSDAVFGPSIAEYDPGAPDWMRNGSYHSNIPASNAGDVITGHTCNALVRWKGKAWRDIRFDLERGRSGGEDTAYFFWLHRAGARFALCPEAVVREVVEPQRLSLRWLAKRKFRCGQSFSASATGRSSKLRLAAAASAKASACALGAAANLLSAERRNYWLLRGLLHAGVVAGCFNIRQTNIYGLGDAG